MSGNPVPVTPERLAQREDHPPLNLNRVALVDERPNDYMEVARACATTQAASVTPSPTSTPTRSGGSTRKRRFGVVNMVVK